MPQYDYDRFGYCVICSKQVIAIEYIGGKQQTRKLDNWSEQEVVLNDNSRMRICVCKECIPNIIDNYDLIMNKVYKGWEHDIVQQQWPAEKKEIYLNRYRLLKITGIV